jgi:hypothetical protein
MSLESTAGKKTNPANITKKNEIPTQSNMGFVFILFPQRSYSNNIIHHSCKQNSSQLKKP